MAFWLEKLTASVQPLVSGCLGLPQLGMRQLVAASGMAATGQAEIQVQIWEWQYFTYTRINSRTAVTQPPACLCSVQFCVSWICRSLDSCIAFHRINMMRHGELEGCNKPLGGTHQAAM